MPKRHLLRIVTRILARQGVQVDRRVAPCRGPGVAFRVGEPAHAVRVEALVLEGEWLVFALDTELDIPRGRLDAVGEWTLHANAAQAVATFVLDRAKRTLVVRHAVDCRALTVALLTKVLPLAWDGLAATWLGYAPQLLPILVGRSRTTALAGAGVGAGGDGRSARSDGDEGEDEIERGIAERLMDVVAERFGDEVADVLDGALRSVAGAYLERCAPRARPETIRARVQGDDERATLLVATPRGKTMFYRFSPRAVRELAETYGREMTLYFHARPADAERVLAQGFADEPFAYRVGFFTDAEGVPICDGAEQATTAVRLTSRPLPRDDRGDRSAVVRVVVDPDATDLATYEHAFLACDGSETWTPRPSVQEWFVPAEVLNAAVRDRFATVSLAV